MSYCLNEEYESFLIDKQREENQNALYILKPVAASCGRGIKLIDSKTNVSKKQGILACKYVPNPHLINGLKYDLRVYVLVTSFNPMKVYIYDDGLVRFATEKYNLDPNKLNDRFIHLTNFSVNKKNSKFVKNNDKGNKRDDESSDGEAQLSLDSSKWDFKMLAVQYSKMGINYGLIFNQIKDVVFKTLLSVENVINQGLQKNPTNR